MKARLNLATRPFRNEALPNLLFVVGVVLAVVLSVRHATHLNSVLGETSSALHQQVAAAEVQLAALRREGQQARVALPEQARLAEWRVIKELVDRRVFSWSLLLSRLQSVLPPGVRLLTITPNLSRGEMQLDVAAVARSRAEGFELARALEAQGSFKQVYPEQVQTSSRGEEFTYTMHYKPSSEP